MANEYEDMLQSDSGVGVSHNEYDDLIQSDYEEQKSIVKGNINLVKDITPQRQIEVLDLSKKMNLPTEFVERNYESLSAKESDLDYDKLIAETPGFTEFLQKKENAALAKDDMDALHKIDLSNQRFKPLEQEPGFFSTATKSGFNQLEMSTIMLGAGYGLISPDQASEFISDLSRRQSELQEQKPSYRKELDKIIEDEGGDVTKAFNRFYGSFGDIKRGLIMQGLKDFAAGGFQTVGEAIDFFNETAVKRTRGTAHTILENLVSSSPSLLAGIGGGAAGGAAGTAVAPGPGTAVGGVIGFAGGTFVGSSAVEIGSEISSELSSRGYDLSDYESVQSALRDPQLMKDIRARAERKGLTTAAIDGLFSLTAGRFLKGAKPGITSKVVAGVKEIGVQSTGEVLSEFGGQVAREQGDVSKTNFGEAVFEGIASMGHSVGEVTAARAREGVQSIRNKFSKDTAVAAEQIVKQTTEALKLTEDIQTIKEIGVQISETKNIKNVPEKVEELLNYSSGGEDVKSIFFQSDDFDNFWTKKGKSPAKAAEQLLGDAKSYHESKETGQPIEVPLGKFIANASQTEDFDGLLNEARTAPDGMKVKEARDHMAQLPQVMSELANEAVSAQITPEDQVREQESKEISADVQAQLEATGMASRDAKSYAKVYEAAFNTLSKRAGVSAKELYGKYGLTINQRKQQGTVLNQQKYQPVYDEEQNSISIESKDVSADGEFMSAENIEDWVNPEGSGYKKIDIEKIGLDKFENPFSFQHLEVKRDKRGQGIGTDAFKAMELEAINRGADVILINASPIGTTNKAGELVRLIKWYESFGYKLIRKSKENAELFKDVSKTSLEQDGKLFTKDDVAKSIKSMGREINGSAFDRFAKDQLFELRDVDVARLYRRDEKSSSPLFLESKDDESWAEDYSKKYKGDTAQPIVVQNDGHGGFNIIDGRHRGRAAFLRGEKTIKAYVAVGPQTKLFQQGRGQISFGANRQFNIDLLNAADPSTFLHETGHFYLEILGDLAETEGATKQVKDDYATILNWFGVQSRTDIKVEHHEQFARGFEAYLMEGKAPSQGLRRAFARFKVWLTSVYRQLKNLNVTLTPEVNQVFDRMLATDEEIAQANENFEPLMQDPATYGMTGEKAVRYMNARDDARMAAEEQMLAKMMHDWSREREKWWKQGVAAYRAELEPQVNEMPVYKALFNMQRGTLPDGSPLPAGSEQIKLSRQALVDAYGADFVKSLPKPYVYTREGGMTPDVAAPFFGFQSGDEMITAIKNMPSKGDYLDTLAEQKMKEANPDIMDDPQLEDRALEVIHNDKRAKLLRLELEHLLNNDLPISKEVIKRTVRRMPSDKFIKDNAAKIVGSKSIKKSKPHLFIAAEKKYSKEASAALVKGDLDAAFMAKQKELLNHEMFREAVRRQEDYKKSIQNFKKLWGSDEKLSKSRDIDLVNAGRAILAQYGLGRTSRPVDEYLRQIRQYDSVAYETVSELIKSATEGAGYYKDVTLDQFQSMSDAVMALWDLAKTSTELDIAGKKISKERAIEDLNARISEINGGKEKGPIQRSLTPWEKTKAKILSFRAAASRVEHWISAVDKNSSGPFTTMIFNPIVDATTNYRIKKRAVMEQYKNHVEKYKHIFTRDPITVQSLNNFKFENKQQLLGALLHSGNESNLSKLLRGYGWGDKNADGTLNRSKWDKALKDLHDQGILKKDDWDFVQGVWDMFESFKPDTQKAHKKMFGFYFKEITADEVTTPFGVYRGGYAPAKVDFNLSEDAAIRQDKDLLENMSVTMAFPTTGKGATMTRVEQYAAPLQIDFNLVGGHIDWALRFSYIEPSVRDVNKIMSDKNFRANLAQIDEAAARDMFTPWLQRAAQQSAVTISDSATGKVLDAMARKIRGAAAMQIMTGNVINTLQQYTGLVVAMSKIKPRHMKTALMTYLSDIKGSSQFAVESSKWFDATQKNNVYEAADAIQDVLVNPTVFENIKDFSRRHMYFLQTAAQNQVNTIVWTAAYNQAIENKMTHDEAVREADSVVRTTQGSANPEDISAFESGTATERLFKQFVGYFNMLANLNGFEMLKTTREVGLKKGAGRMLYVYTTALMLPAVLSELIMRAGIGKIDDDDDDEYLDDMLSIFFGSQFRTITAMTPYVGTYVQTSLNQFNEKRYDDRLSLAPAINLIESTTKVPKEVYDLISGDLKNKKGLTRDTLLLMGVATGVPLAPLSKPVGYLQDVQSGEARPTGPIDFTRGLVTGRPGGQ